MARISTASGYPGKLKGRRGNCEGARGSQQTQDDLLLLRLELLFGEDPLPLQRGELLELGRVVKRLRAWDLVGPSQIWSWSNPPNQANRLSEVAVSLE
jgi:hypothetical protein